MTRVFIYSLSASINPDNIYCVVPWQVDDSLTFFGPCKKRMRMKLRAEFLREDISHVEVHDNIYVVGVNGGNQRHERKIVWWGKISEVMTFWEADRRLAGDRYQSLRDHEMSPLHVRPIFEQQTLIGYKHVSNEHIDRDSWIDDLLSSSRRNSIDSREREIRLRHGKAWDVFDRDCCMLLENRFFARGNGIRLEKIALEILRDAQPQKPRHEINDYAIFGITRNNQANGLRGTYLEMTGSVADRFVDWLEGKSVNPRIHEQTGNNRFFHTVKKRCY